jgi:hypothetical protein
VIVIRVDRAEERIGRTGIVPSRPLEPLPSGFDRSGRQAEPVFRAVARGARAAVASRERPEEVHGAAYELRLVVPRARLSGGGPGQVVGVDTPEDVGELGLVVFGGPLRPEVGRHIRRCQSQGGKHREKHGRCSSRCDEHTNVKVSPATREVVSGR